MATKILIVEDSPTALVMMQGVLSQEGYEVYCAETGEQALALAPQLKPDLVILDTLLPDMKGFEVSSRLRQNPELAGVKILIMTGAIEAIDAVQARRAGADDYCVKTGDMAVIVETVKKMLG